MKKLLALLGTVTIGATSPVTVMYAVTPTPIDMNNAIQASTPVAEALIQKDQGYGLNSQSYLDYAKSNDPNIMHNTYRPGKDNSNLSLSRGLQKTFGQDTDLSKMINSISGTKDTDSTESGFKINSTMSDIALVFNTLGLGNSKILSDPNTGPSYVQDLLYLANFPKLLGSILGTVIGSDNPIVKAFINMPISALSDAITNFKTTYGSTVYTGSFAPYALDGSIDVADTKSAFGIAETNMLIPTLDIFNKTITAKDYTAIASFALLIINYLSQFNINTVAGSHLANNSISDHMYDANLTNEAYRTKIDNEKFQDTNFTNLQSLITNLLSFDSNNGLGFSQLLDLLFGSEKSIGVSAESHTTNLVDLNLVPDIHYYNPITSFVQGLLSLGTHLDKLLTSINSPMRNIIWDTHIIEQGVTLIGGLLDNIATNQTIDNQLNMISGATSSLDLILKTLGISLPSNIGTIISKENALDTDLRANAGWINQNDKFTISSIEPFTGSYDIPLNQTTAGTTWNDLYSRDNSHSTSYAGLSDLVSAISSAIGLKNILPNTFTNIKSLLDGFTSKTIAGTSLTISQVLSELDDKNGLLGTLIANMGPLSKMVADMLNSIGHATMPDANGKNVNINTVANQWIKDNVDPTADKTGEITKLEANKTNLLDNLSIMSIAAQQDSYTASFKANTAYTTAAEDMFFEFIGYDVNSGDTVKDSQNTIFSILKSNWSMLMKIVTAAGNSINGINKDMDAPFAKNYNYFTTPGDAPLSNQNIDKQNNITYTIDLVSANPKDKQISYNVELYYNSTDNDYTIGLVNNNPIK